MELTVDWSWVRERWPRLLSGYVGKPGLRFLEIGCFEGHATVWMLENVLTDPSSRIDVIDTFAGNPGWPAGQCEFKQRFLSNIAPYASKVGVHHGPSQEILRTLDAAYDMVYVDGSHIAPNALTDAVLAWPMLKPGGLMFFDDYEWPVDKPETEKPKLAVDTFVRVYADQLDTVDVGYQYVVRKR